MIEAGSIDAAGGAAAKGEALQLFISAFPLFGEPSTTVPFGIIRREPSSGHSLVSPCHCSILHSPSLAHPSSGFASQAATWKHRREICKWSLLLRLHILPPNDQNVSASVTQGGDLKTLQTILTTCQLFFKEHLSFFFNCSQSFIKTSNFCTLLFIKKFVNWKLFQIF